MLKPQLSPALIVAMFGTLWLSSCSGERSPVAPEDLSESQSNEVLTRPDPPPQHPAIERVSAGIKAVGPFRPALPISLVASGKANRPAETTRLEVLSLDEDLTESSLVARPGRSRPLKHLDASLARGAQVQTTATVTFPEPGYYRVLAHVTASSNVPPVQGDSIILDESDRTLWMLVDEDGGRLTEGWDSLALAGRQPKFGSYGPFASPRLAETAEGVASVLASTYSYSGRITYYNRPIDRRDPVPSMQVTIGCGYQSTFGTIYEYSNVSTDANGNWSTTCASNRPLFSINANHFNGYARVKGRDGNFAGVGLFDSNGGTFPDMRVANDDAAVTFLILTRRVPQVFSKFGRSRSVIEVWVRDDDTTGYSPVYESGPDRIKTNFLRTFPPRGHFTALHEYGHAFHWKAIEAPLQNNCPIPHSISGQYTLSCAFVEGFADFVGAWIPGDSLVNVGFTDYDIESNVYRTLGDGSRIEGAVAAFFYDLVDGTTERDNASNTGKFVESFDSVAYPASYLAQVIESCFLQVSSTSFVTRLDGVDQFVYCAERSLAAQSLPQYFSTRAVNYSTFSESATEPLSWSSTDIRRIWLRDLYDDAP